MDIELPDFVPPAPDHVDSSKHPLTSIPDVYRHYDLNKAEREEPAVTAAPATEDA